MANWNAVVRETTSQGLLGQLGFGEELSSPISMIGAPAEAGSARSAASTARTSRFAFMLASNTSERLLLPCELAGRLDFHDVDGLLALSPFSSS